MNRSLSTERLYSLGNYSNIKFNDTITEIPSEVATNQEATRLLRYLQLIEVEYSFARYTQILEETYGSKLPLDQILEFLEQERTSTFADLYKALNEIYMPTTVNPIGDANNKGE